MAKRTYTLFLFLLFLAASACSSGGSAQTHTNLPSSTILETMLAASPEADEASSLKWYLSQEEVDDYLTGFYGLSGLQDCDAAILRMGGARAFELAVLQPDIQADETDSIVAQLQQYLLNRQGDFTGYAPEQATLVEQARILTQGRCIALLICEAPDAVQAAFEACFDQTADSFGSLDASPAVRPDGRVPYTPPGIDDMTIYDTAAILSAWNSGDSSALSSKDRAIFSAAGDVFNRLISDDMSPLETEQALYGWLLEHVDYDWDHNIHRSLTHPDSFSPYGALVNGKAVCLGYASTFQLFMDMAGIECITVVGAAFQSREDHAWNMVRLDGAWYCVDATWDIGNSTWLYFNVTSDYMAMTDHQWNYDLIPEAT